MCDVAWGDPRLKSGALQRQILKSLKSVPGHTFEDISPISLKVSKAAAVQAGGGRKAGRVGDAGRARAQGGP